MLNIDLCDVCTEAMFAKYRLVRWSASVLDDLDIDTDSGGLRVDVSRLWSRCLVNIALVNKVCSNASLWMIDIY